METIEHHREKQINALENRIEKEFLDTDKKSITSLFSKDFLNENATLELKKKSQKWKINSINIICKACNKKKDKIYDF